MSESGRKGRRFTLPGDKLEDLKEHAQRKVRETRVPQEVAAELSLDKLAPAPWNARRFFDPEAIRVLGKDLKENGQIHPILVRPQGVGFEVVVGERRYRAALDAGLTRLRAYVRPLDDASAQRVSLAENLEREDLSPFEETLGYLQLLTLELDGLPAFQAFKTPGEPGEQAVKRLLYSLYGRSQRRVNNVINAPPEPQLVTPIEAVFGARRHMSWQSFVQNRLPILDLPDELLEALQRGDLEYTKATALARVEDTALRSTLLERVLREHWPLAMLRAEIRKSKSVAQDETRAQGTTERAALVAQLFKKQYATKPPAVRRRAEKLLAELERLLSE